MRVGFVGLGNMGGDQAMCIAGAFPDLAVYDVSGAAMARLAGRARLAASVADVGRNADVVDVCVRDDQQVRAVLEGEDGLLACMPQGSVVLIHSTIGPKTVIDLASKGEARGVTVIDAAVTRTAFVEEGPFVFTMTGGAEAVTERVRPVLETFSTDVIHVGALGSAMVLKLCNNLVGMTEILVVKQAFALAAAGGVPAAKLTQVMKRNGNLTPTMEVFSERRRRADESVADLQARLERSAGNCEKDFAHAAQIADELGVRLPTAPHGREFYRWATTTL